ncbi:CotS family spore coat protein [Clostridium sp. 19966]|uniref:CotS family spore coat protein n=1 Tax=Clostridium sp. 19966 TaxID=2768166 RepID=UPI0028DDB72A|nr:CotS family spore coat protein [Clostridium sp. 19966]MDT8715636.1 CotS family spore coat protein [Clostridium sp. 19966]
MDTAFLKYQVEKRYDIHIDSIKKIKNVYKICDKEHKYCLKVIKYELGHFLFILQAINHLILNGFNNVPSIIETLDGQQYISLENYYAYLTPWINARESNYDNPVDIERSAKILAELHVKSRGFQLEREMKPRIGWFKWAETFNVRRKEILDFKWRIERKSELTDFDKLYLENAENEMFRAECAIKHIENSQYYNKMMQEVNLRGFCHHDFAHHNVLIDIEGKANVIDFDYVILDSHLHDLSSLLLRRMKNGKWDIDGAKFILDAYSLVHEISEEEIPIMASFMEFPQDFWQVGIQYYWEKQPWEEDFFEKKLLRIVEDSDDKQEFIEEFMHFKYK